MKYREFALTILAAIFIISCARQEKAHPERTENTPTTTIKSIAEELDGFWISDDYLNAIEKTKQLYANTNHKTNLFGFILKKDQMLKGKPDLEGFNTFESGYIYPLKFNANGYFELDNVRRGKYPDTDLMQIKPTTDGKTEIKYTISGKKDIFRKIAPSNNNNPLLVNQFISATIFSGNYVDNNTGAKIQFKDNSTITGFDKYTLYTVGYAFEDKRFDVVYFAKSETDPNPAEYHFVFEGNVVKLYNVVNNDAEMEYTYSHTPSYVWHKK